MRFSSRNSSEAAIEVATAVRYGTALDISITNVKFTVTNRRLRISYLATKSIAFFISIFGLSSCPRMDRTDRAQYENLVSISPHWSPEKEPSDCCKLAT